MTDRTLDTLDDAELAHWTDRKKEVVARARGLLDTSEAEIVKLERMIAESEVHESADLASLRETRTTAERARHGRLGAHASAKVALDAALAEQRRRAEATARSAATAAKIAFDEHVVRIGAETTAAAATMATMMAELHSRAQACRIADHAARTVTGERPITHAGHFDPYSDSMALDGAVPGLHETTRTLVEFSEGKLWNQQMHANAAAAREASLARRSG